MTVCFLIIWRIKNSAYKPNELMAIFVCLFPCCSGSSESVKSVLSDLEIISV